MADDANQESNEPEVNAPEGESANVLDLPDEEFAAMDFDAMDQAVADNSEEVDDTSEDPDEEDAEVSDTSEENVDNEDDDQDTSDLEEEETLDDPEEDDELDPEDTTTAEDFMAQVMAPIKANGKDFQIKDAEEARRLMSMGAGFHKKMESMKPHLKMIRTLQQNELLDEGKLNKLIDLHNHNPDAIAQLLKDSKTDPLSIDMEAELDYTPKTHTVDDAQLNLESVIESIEDSPHYQEVANVISTEWDEASRSAIYENPAMVEVLNEHMGNGVYETVNDEVNRQRVLGGLSGLSNAQAYWKVGQELAQKGTFQQEDPKPAKVVRPRAKAAPDPSKTDKRKKASSTKGRQAAQHAEPDYLNMSDEEYEKKYGGSHY